MEYKYMHDSFERMITILREEFEANDLGEFTVYIGNSWPAWNSTYPDAYAALIPEFPHKLFQYILPLTEEEDNFSFYELTESFGFSCSPFHGDLYLVFPHANFNFDPSQNKNYRELLSDQRWKDRARLVRKIASEKCEDCGSFKERLEVHHCYYRPMREGYAPWEYPLRSLRALCRQCHESRAVVELNFRSWMSGLTQGELSSLLQVLERKDISAIMSALEDHKVS